MTFDDLIHHYRGVLKEKYERIDHALEAFRALFPGFISASGLPMPAPVTRAGIGSVRDIVTVNWLQEVARPGRMVTVRIDWTVSISAFHFSVRDPRDPQRLNFNEAACPDFQVPEWFIDESQKLIIDKDLPYARWEAKIYTY